MKPTTAMTNTEDRGHTKILKITTFYYSKCPIFIPEIEAWKVLN